MALSCLHLRFEVGLAPKNTRSNKAEQGLFPSNNVLAIVVAAVDAVSCIVIAALAVVVK